MRALQTELAEARLGLSASAKVRDEHNSDDLQTQCQQLMGKLAVAETEGERARTYSHTRVHTNTRARCVNVHLLGWSCGVGGAPLATGVHERTHARTHTHTHRGAQGRADPAVGAPP